MEIITIVAIVASPIVAVLVSMWLQNRKEKRQHQLTLLGSLMATRHEALSAETIRSLNLIDLVFHNKAKVRRLWKDYLDMLGNEGLNNPLGWGQRSKKLLELITEIAKTLGYGKEISHLDTDRIYSPVGPLEQLQRNQELQAELLRVLKASARIETAPRDQLTPPAE